VSPSSATDGRVLRLNAILGDLLCACAKLVIAWTRCLPELLYSISEARDHQEVNLKE
jgi:hypothetical protein